MKYLSVVLCQVLYSAEMSMNVREIERNKFLKIERTSAAEQPIKLSEMGRNNFEILSLRRV